MFKFFKNSFPFESTSDTQPKPKFTYACTKFLDDIAGPLEAKESWFLSTCAQNSPVKDSTVPMKIVEVESVNYDSLGIRGRSQKTTFIHTPNAEWKYERNSSLPDNPIQNNLTQKVERNVYNGDILDLTLANEHKEALKFWDKHANPLPSVENKSMRDGIDSFFGNGDWFQRNPEELFANLGGTCTSGCRTKMGV